MMEQQFVIKFVKFDTFDEGRYNLNCLLCIFSLLPTKAQILFADFSGLSSSMDEFKGRGTKAE